MLTYFRIVLLALVCVLISSCGGGGGGGGSFEDGFLGAANVSMDAGPKTIDTGDRTLVRIDLFNVHEDGIALKIRYPLALTFVSSSARLVLDEDSEENIRPRVENSDGDAVYLVFYISSFRFSAEGSGTIYLQLQGLEQLDNARIEVDADVDDPKIDNSVEFDITNPLFTEEAAVSVRVR